MAARPSDIGGSIIEALSGGIVTFDDGAIIHNSGGAAIAALCGGTVNLNGTTVYNRNGSIEADGIGAMILLAGAMIVGGTLETSAHGIIETVADTGNTTFDGVTIAGGSNVQVSDDTTLTLQDTIDGNATVTNDGTITLVQGCHSSLIINGNITLAGSGTVVLSGDTDSIVGTGTGTNILHNANTIEGSGTIGGDDLVFVNQACGIVDADACGHTLVLDTGTTVINLGLLEATNGGTLEIEDSVCNVGGTIAASGCGSVVDLIGVTITGGTLETSCGGLIQTVAGLDDAATTSTFDDVTIGCNSDVKVADQTTLILEDGTTMFGGRLSIACSGVIDVEHGSNDGSGGATLDGVNVTDNGALDIGDAGCGAILTLDDGTTVTGHGTGTLTINAYNTVDVEHGSNDGSGGATLDGVNVTDNGAIDIGDAGCGAILTLDDGTTVTGHGTGTLTINAHNTLDVEHGGNDGSGGATLDGVNVTDNGALDIGDAGCGAILKLDDGTTVTGHGTGSLTINAGNTLDVEHGGNEGNGGATLDGVHVTDNGALDVGDAGSGAILTLDGGTTVSGCGAMTINAGNTLDVDGGTTTIDLGGTITNNGTLQASHGGTLDIVSHVDNSSGTLEADSGGILDVQSAICGGTATIHGGTLEFDKSSNVSVTFCNGSADSPTYGTLVLGDPKDFQGTITGFDGTAAGACNSDTVELKGFCETSYSVQCSGGNEILTLHDGDRCVTLTFDDFNNASKSKTSAVTPTSTTRRRRARKMLHRLRRQRLRQLRRPRRLPPAATTLRCRLTRAGPGPTTP